MEAAVASSNVASEPPAATEPAAAAVPQPSAQKSPFKKGHSGKSPARRQRNPKGSNQNEPPVDLNSNRKVMVSGYPHYTQPQDLARIFSTFGTVKVDNSFNKFSTLLFSTTEEAAAALQSSDKVNIYGEFLSVKPFDGKQVEEAMNSKQRHGKQAFPRSKDTAVIIDPNGIDLTGDFPGQVRRVLRAVMLTDSDIQSLDAVYKDVQDALQKVYPGCEAWPFGSIVTGLGMRTSDADCFVHMPRALRVPSADFVRRAAGALAAHAAFAAVLPVARASTPIVKLLHRPTQTSCDVSFKTPLSFHNSRILGHLLKSNRRATELAVLVKYWALQQGVVRNGRLNNYTLSWLVVFHLQRPPALLPPVAALQADPARQELVDGWNVGFDDSAELLATENDTPLEELLLSFFEFYAAFDFATLAICPFLGEAIPKASFVDCELLPAGLEPYKRNLSSMYVSPFAWDAAACLQDPVKQFHNVTGGVRPLAVQEFQRSCQQSAAAGRAAGVAGLLRAALTRRAGREEGDEADRVSVTLCRQLRGARGAVRAVHCAAEGLLRQLGAELRSSRDLRKGKRSAPAREYLGVVRPEPAEADGEELAIRTVVSVERQQARLVVQHAAGPAGQFSRFAGAVRAGAAARFPRLLQAALGARGAAARAAPPEELLYGAALSEAMSRLGAADDPPSDEEVALE